MEIAVFQFIGYSIENMTNSFIVDGAGNLIDAIKPLVISCVTIYLMTQAYVQIMGKTDDLAIDVFKTGVVVICITTLTLSVDNYTTYVVDGVKALGDGLTSAILPNNNNQSVFGALDNLLQKGIDQAVYCFERAGWSPSSWMWVFCAIAIIIAIGGLTAISATIIIGTKFILTMLLVIGPIFMIAACFPLTRKFIDSWLGKLFENILVQVFAITIIFLAIRIIDTFISNNDISTDEYSNPAGIVIQIAIICAILVYVIRQIPNLAGSLAGGFASAMMQLPNLPKLQPKDPKQDPPRDSWEKQQQNRIENGGAKTGSTPKNDLSRDLKDRIAQHNLKDR